MDFTEGPDWASCAATLCQLGSKSKRSVEHHLFPHRQCYTLLYVADVNERPVRGTTERTSGKQGILSADLVLLHAPALFDFRNRRDVYFPFLGTSGDVPITPLYEYFPIGFKMLDKYLSERGHSVAIANLSTILLRQPKLNVNRLIASIDAELIGIDLHWMVHVQGSLAIASLVKSLRPDVPIVFGGISSTYFAEELIRYPFIDMVMRGYDTLEPMNALLRSLKADRKGLTGVPNLLWKTTAGTVRQNEFSHKPAAYGVGVDWATMPREEAGRTLPILEFLSTQNAGCTRSCGWCGGSREAFRSIYGKKQSIARKRPEEVEREFESIRNVDGIDCFHFYSIGSYNESRGGMERFLDQVGQTGLKSVSYEQYHLTAEPVLKRMAEANRHTTITLSPESHDQRVAKLAGRGVYTNDEMERWIDRALTLGIQGIDIWYFVGMPEQDEASVYQTVDYCERLLGLFGKRRVNPMLCPMIPFLDPASAFFEQPEEHGYRLFYRTVEEHRRGMERASPINRINYETRWLKREDLVYVGFRAVRRLMQAKGAHGLIPPSWVRNYVSQIDDALEFTAVVHEADCISNPRERGMEIERLGDEIQKRNDSILYSGVANQAFPANREIGGRWIDELGWSQEALDSMIADGVPDLSSDSVAQ
jgi:clorobiocin biosynthesis protein CloN6